MNIFRRYVVASSAIGHRRVWSLFIRYRIFSNFNKMILASGEKLFSIAKLRNTIIIESHNDFDCNGGAIYDYLLEHSYNEKYRIVWLVKNKVSRKLPYNIKAYNIYLPSIRKTWNIATAKYIFSDDIITKKMKDDQVSVYCTHGGCTFKNVKGLIVVPNHVDYILSSSSNYDPYMCINYSIPYPNKRMLHFGFPYNDILFKNCDNEIKKITQREFNKIVLWMPTFRKNKNDYFRQDSLTDFPFGIPIISSQLELNELNKILAELNCLLIIKIHPMQDPITIRGLKDKSNIIVLDADIVKRLNVDSYRLMKASDAFISDYSSSAYSFLLLDRPMGFVLEDYKTYLRGLIISDYRFAMPGELINSFSDMISFCRNICNGIDQHHQEREKLLDWMYENREGNSTEKLIRFLQI